MALETGALAGYLWNALVIESAPGLWTRPLPALAALLGLILLSALGLTLLVRLYTRFLTLWTGGAAAEVQKGVVWTFSPLLLLGMTFVQKLFPLGDIDRTLLFLAAGGIIILQAVLLSSRGAGHPQKLEGQALKRLSVRLFLLAFLVYTAYVSGLVFPAQPFTGDEPHYLLIAKSLLSDGDINLADDYRDREYAAFYDGTLDVHANPGKKGPEFLYSRHLPGLPLLVSPFYAAGDALSGFLSSLSRGALAPKTVRIFLARLPICLLTAVLGVLFFRFVTELTGEKRAALWSWALFSFAAPVVFYSHLIYPEIPVAVVLLGISYEIILKKNLSSGRLIWAGAGIALLPWFGIKYIPLAAAAFAVVLYAVLRSGQKSLRQITLFFVPLAVSAGAFIWFLLSIWGTLAPQAVYRGSFAPGQAPLSRFLARDFGVFFSKLMGFFWDQRAGLFIYSPVYTLCLAGFWMLGKKRPRETLSLSLLFFVFWSLAALAPYWSGYCPPARPLLPVIWIPAAFMSWALFRSPNRLALTIRYALIAVSIVIVIVSLSNPRILYHESLSLIPQVRALDPSAKILAGLDNLLFKGASLFPVLLTPFAEQRTWAPFLFWLFAAAAVSWITIGKRKREDAAEDRPSLALPLVLVLSLCFLAAATTLFHVRLENGFRAGEGGMVFYPQDKNCFSGEIGGFWVRGKSRARLVIKTERPLQEASFVLRSPVAGRTILRLGNTKRAVKRGPATESELTVRFSSPHGLRWKESYLYFIEVKEERGFYPYNIDRKSKDKRFLGVFLRPK